VRHAPGQGDRGVEVADPAAAGDVDEPLLLLQGARVEALEKCRVHKERDFVAGQEVAQQAGKLVEGPGMAVDGRDGVPLFHRA
jgi:hypothetical protein